MKQYNGIQGLEGHGVGRKQAWGAVVTIGQRHPQKGYPTDSDKFFIKKPQALNKTVNGKSMLIREADPDFWKFNESEKMELRQNIRFHIVHPVHLRDGWAGMQDCFEFSLKAYQIPGIKQHENKFPTCTGNGEDATRWNGKEFEDIKCPNQLCKYRQANQKSCKPFARIAFQLRWPDKYMLPSPLVKFETKSWYNIDKVIMPWFMGLHKQAMALGVENYNFFGLPGVIKLGKRVAGSGKSVPSIAIATDFQNGTLQSFFMHQKQIKQQLLTEVQYEQLPSD